MTTYLTIDSFGAHGNNEHKTVIEDLPWSVNGYKKPIAAERTLNSLFGSMESLERVAEPFVAHCL